MPEAATLRLDSQSFVKAAATEKAELLSRAVTQASGQNYRALSEHFLDRLLDEPAAVPPRCAWWAAG